MIIAVQPEKKGSDPQMKKTKAEYISTKLTFGDYMGAFLVRWGIGRMKYGVRPGLYAVGAPDDASPVFVTANYKLSLDHLRKNLTGISAWIVVLDTKGINVWCAAGKGTFGTKEIIRRVLGVQLFDLVKHRTLILPQLGAPGVAAHEVKKSTGFTVIYGPVRAADIGRFMAAGMKKDDEMRRVRFTFMDRLVLVPLEITMAKKILLLIIAGAFIAGLLSRSDVKTSAVWSLFMMSGIFAGSVLSPLLLPWLPFKRFSLKGFTAGAALLSVLYYLLRPQIIDAVPLALIALSLSAYLALQFTGASTYTSENGVRREIRQMIRPVYAVGIAGAVLLAVRIVYGIISNGGLS